MPRRPRRQHGTHRLVLAPPTTPQTSAAEQHRHRARRRAVRTLGVLVLLLGLLWTLPVGAQAVTQPRTLLAQHPVSAGPVEAGFPIDHVGVRFDLPPGMDAHEVNEVAVRFRHGRSWGAWSPVGEDGAQATGSWTGALVAAHDADAYQVRGVPQGVRAARAAAINTTDGPRVVVGERRAGAADAAAPCRSRADWGADESLRTSTRSHAPVQLLTVHHTAGDNAAAASDPDAVVRAIYSWHIEGNGWDDIGYQTLISPDGTLYEGRWSGRDSRSCLTGGGDGTDFAHQTDEPTSPIVTGAHTGGHNTGNLGVALLGTYEDVAPTSAARAALVTHLASVSGRHGLDPTGTVAYDNGVNAGTFPTIAGHRDINATLCPGGVLYDDLPQVRQDVAAALAPTDEPTTEPDEQVTEPIEALAHGEHAVSGTITGTHLDTAAADGVVQTITEVASGGKPSRRHGLLEHVWLVDVPADGSATLVVDATATSGGDGFAFAVSTDGASWTHVLTVASGTGGAHSGTLPAGASGTVQVRVLDTARPAGESVLDAISLDHLAVRTQSDATVPPAEEPEAAPAIELTATGWKDQGRHVVELRWTGATDVVVHRDATSTAVTGSSWTDRIGAKGSATYTYRVCAGTTCSAPVTVTF